MKLKPMFTVDQFWRVRLFRIIWERGVVGDGQGYSAFFSVSLEPRLWRHERPLYGWAYTILGLRLHYQRSYGGSYT